jgi:hypothetical protein
MDVAARTDFIRDVVNLERMRVRLTVGYKAADAGDSNQYAFVLQLAQCPIGRHARYAKLPHDLVFGRHACRRGPFARINIGQNMILDLQVQRLHR